MKNIIVPAVLLMFEMLGGRTEFAVHALELDMNEFPVSTDSENIIVNNGREGYELRTIVFNVSGHDLNAQDVISQGKCKDKEDYVGWLYLMLLGIDGDIIPPQDTENIWSNYEPKRKVVVDSRMYSDAGVLSELNNPESNSNS